MQLSHALFQNIFNIKLISCIVLLPVLGTIFPICYNPRMLLGLLFSQPLIFILVVTALVMSLTIHEFAHAFAADKLGDNTPRLLGRLSLNPKAHLDPIGSLLLLVAGFGWGRPVPFNPINMKNPKRDSAIVAFAGPLSNISLAVVFTLLLNIIGTSSILSGFFYRVIFYNLVLGIFNLIPLHPLDGFKVVAGLLPTNLHIQWMEMEKYGTIMLLILVVTGSVDIVVRPLINGALLLLGL